MSGAGSDKYEDVSVWHEFSAQAGVVFDAWVTPEIARNWLFSDPSGLNVRTEINACPGGEFTIVDRRAGDDVAHVGRYVTVERPLLLVFDFAVPKYSAEYSRVSVVIDPRHEGCELTLTSERVLKEWVEPSRRGWNELLDRLSVLLDEERPRLYI